MSFIRTDRNRNLSAIANIASNVITLDNYQVDSSLYALSSSAIHTLNTMNQSNLNVTSSILNENINTSGIKGTHLVMKSVNVLAPGNSTVVNNLNGNNISLTSMNNQNGNVSNISHLNMRNLNVSSYLYGNDYTLNSITLSNGNGTFNKNVDINGSLNGNVLNNNNLSITQLENSNELTVSEGNVTNNLNATDFYTNDASIANNNVNISKSVDMNATTTITRFDNSDLFVTEKQNNSTILQKNTNNLTLAQIGASDIVLTGSGTIDEMTICEDKTVRMNASIINGIFEDDLNITALLGTVNGISLLNSNVVNISDTLYVTTEYNHTKNDLNTNGNLITTTNTLIAPTTTISNESNVSRRIFNTDTVSSNSIEATTFYVNDNMRAGNMNAGAINAGSYNALRRITTTGNVEANVITSTGLRGTGEFIFNSEVDINTLQTTDLNLNNTTITYLSSNSEGSNIDIANLNSYITSNVITGYSTANIIAGNVVQDIVVGNVLANVKVGEVVTGNIYLGNILTEIIVSNTTANLIVGNLSTFITIGNTVSNVVVGNISSNVFIGNLDVIGVIGNVTSNVIVGNITSNIISGYV